MKNEIISIIVPIYNGETYIDRCLESIVKQTYKALEIILINDGSTDESERKCIEWEKKDNRVLLFSQPNKGVSEARNMGLAKAKGKYIAFVDIDDTCEKDMFFCLHDSICQTKSDIVFCGFYRCNEQGNVLYEQTGYKFLRYSNVKAVNQLAAYNYDCGLWNKLFLREKIWNDLYKITFDKKYAIGEDYIWLLRVLEVCNYVSAIDKCLYNYYHIEGSASHALCLDEKNLNHLYALEECSRIVRSIDSMAADDPVNRLYIQSRRLKLIAYVQKEKDYLHKIDEIIIRNNAEKKWFQNKKNSRISKIKQIFINFTYICKLNGKVSLWIYNFMRREKIEAR